jgi:hypothetical protein
MESLNSAKKKRDVIIMINMFHDLNKQMYLPINHLEQNKVGVEYITYLAFLITYVIQIYTFAMNNIICQTNEQTSNTVTEFINTIEKDIVKCDSNTPIYNGLGTTIAMTEIAKNIMDNIGEELDMLFGNGKIDNNYFKPLTDKLLLRLTSVEGLDHVKDNIADTLNRFAYTYISAWS